ncbi:lipocalin family protein [Chryseobacterium sp. Marseille-Q3244]|uniref:lipocalin family protein n=1 Tax=Chryseobacterium sp. Marseille-Q3244 TaxID=2758092 RepID=UPI0020241E07|nr:lipocalin family protein [Chryseobacterium sp. Marseille-Q3244]
MKNFIRILLLVGMVSCSSNDDTPTVVDNTNITGSWKPSNYEFRGKPIALNDCEGKGQLVINADYSGNYGRYEMASDNCNLVDSYSGKWSYDKLYNVLILTYTEGTETKTLRKEVESYSETELRIRDNNKNLDGVPGNDTGTLVFRKG